MRMGIAMGLAIGLLFCAGAVQGEETMQGTWKLSAGEADGKALSAKQLRDGMLVIKGNHYSVTLEGKDTITGMQKLGSTPSFKTIDITDANGPHQGHTCQGIYELKGDKFRVAFAPPGEDRPTEFSTAPDSGYWVHVWERVIE